MITEHVDMIVAADTQLLAAHAFLKSHTPPKPVHLLAQTGYDSNPNVIEFVAEFAAGGTR